MADLGAGTVASGQTVLVEGLYFIGGAINNGGLALEWVRDKLYPDLAGSAGFEQLIPDGPSWRRKAPACRAARQSPSPCGDEDFSPGIGGPEIGNFTMA